MDHAISDDLPAVVIPRPGGFPPPQFGPSRITLRRSLRSLITWTRHPASLYPFLLAQNPGYEYIGQALRFCLSLLIKIKAVPARTCTARKLGLDLGEQTLNTKGAGLHGCWSSRAQRLACGEQPGRQSRSCGSPVALTSGFQGTRA